MRSPIIDRPIVLYRSPLSGHAHRVELMLSLLQLPYELVNVDLRAGQHKQADFLAKNPFGQLPVIDDNGFVLYDSNAILVYLASSYDNGNWLPADAKGQALVQQWLSLAAGQIAAGPAAARLATIFGMPHDLAYAQSVAHGVLPVINQLFGSRRYAIGDRPTIADIACYAYIAHAPEGGIALEPYPQIIMWLRRLEALPNFVPMQQANSGARSA